MLKLQTNPNLSRRAKVGLSLLAVGMLATAAVLLVVKPVATTSTTDSGKVVTRSVQSPAETKVADTYKVAKGMPQSIAIPSQNIEGYIQKVGTDQNKAIAAPNNVRLAGWYVHSELPGKRGLSIIDGHVHGVSEPGVFRDLAKVSNGDEITITFGDGSTRKFIVFAVKNVDKDDAAKYIFDQSPRVTSQLNLVTCIGSYDKDDKTYDRRVIVSAKLQ